MGSVFIERLLLKRDMEDMQSKDLAYTFCPYRSRLHSPPYFRDDKVTGSVITTRFDLTE